MPGVPGGLSQGGGARTIAAIALTGPAPTPTVTLFLLPQSWRTLLLSFVWLAAVADLFVDFPPLTAAAAAGLLAFVLLTLPEARRETRWLALVGGAVVLALVATVASPADAWKGLERTLVFAGLLPTLQMTRAVARRMPSVRASQDRLAALPGQAGDIGIAIGSTVFGSVLNTGAYALMSAVLREDASPERRLSAARASMRGMSISALWSPFFVAFAVAGSYLPMVEPWQIIPFGFVCVVGSIVIGLLMFARPLSLGALAAALACLGPIAPRLGIAAGSVVLCGIVTPLTTLGSVLVVMPLLCAVQFWRRPLEAGPVLSETGAAMGRMGDDLLLITVSMVLGTVAGGSGAVVDMVEPLLREGLSAPLLFALMIGIQLVPAMVGVHPIITGTVFLAAITSHPLTVLPVALFEAMLAGWGLGSMISFASLSVVTAGSMYRVPPMRVAFGPNVVYAAVVWGALVVFLSAVDAAVG